MELGQLGTCKCGIAIKWTGKHWEHVGEQFRHAAEPIAISVLEFLQKEVDDLDWPEDEIYDFLVDLNAVWRDADLDERRHYALRDVVVEIDGLFIKFEEIITTGDKGFCDLGLEDLVKKSARNARFVKREERVITEVYYQ